MLLHSFSGAIVFALNSPHINIRNIKTLAGDTVYNTEIALAFLNQ